MQDKCTANVLVVGAGIAGLSAANALKAKGCSVRVLEAGQRPGGRINTVVLNGSHKIDAGAQWLRGTGKGVKGYPSWNDKYNPLY